MVIHRNESVAFGPEQSLDKCRIAGIAFEKEIRTPRQGIVFHGGPDPRDAARDGGGGVRRMEKAQRAAAQLDEMLPEHVAAGDAYLPKLQAFCLQSRKQTSRYATVSSNHELPPQPFTGESESEAPCCFHGG